MGDSRGFDEKARGITRIMVGTTLDDLMKQRQLRIQAQGDLIAAYPQHQQAIEAGIQRLTNLEIKPLQARKNASLHHIEQQQTARDLLQAINDFDLKIGIHYGGNPDVGLILSGFVQEKKLQKDSRYLVYRELLREQKRLMDGYHLNTAEYNLHTPQYNIYGGVTVEAKVGKKEDGTQYALTKTRQAAIDRVKKIGEMAAKLEEDIRKNPEPCSSKYKAQMKEQLAALREQMTSTGSWFGFLTRGKNVSSSGKDAIDRAMWQVDHPGEKQKNALEQAVGRVFGRGR